MKKEKKMKIVKKETMNKLFKREFNCEFLSQEPLLGIKFYNMYLIGDDEIERPLFRIEIGFFFLTLSYTNVDYSDMINK
jgi:hypothetical protein